MTNRVLIEFLVLKCKYCGAELLIKMQRNKLKLVLKGFLNNSLVENTKIVQSNEIVVDKVNY